jgi:hypothetical protein
MSESKNLPLHPKYPALRHAAAHGLSGQPVRRCAARYHLMAAQAQCEASGA